MASACTAPVGGDVTGSTGEALATGAVDTVALLRQLAVPSGTTWVQVDRHGSGGTPDKTRRGGIFRWDATFATDSAFLASFPGGDDDGVVNVVIARNRSAVSNSSAFKSYDPREKAVILR